jgi:hypothetical protein
MERAASSLHHIPAYFIVQFVNSQSLLVSTLVANVAISQNISVIASKHCRSMSLKESLPEITVLSIS